MPASSRFATLDTISENEIANLKENAVPKSIKEATKFGIKLFEGVKSKFFNQVRVVRSFDNKLSTFSNSFFKLTFYSQNVREISEFTLVLQSDTVRQL